MAELKEKLTALTKDQEGAMEGYKDEGCRIGLTLEDNKTDPKRVHDIMNQLRVSCGFEEAEDFVYLDSPKAAVSGYEECNVHNCMYGYHDINWIQHYMFFKKETEIEVDDRIDLMLELAETAGWMWMTPKLNIITKRPVKLNMIKKSNNIKVMHNYNGKAVEFADGYGVYMINGVQIPKDLTYLVDMPAEEIDIKTVLDIKNTEIRTEFLKKVGIEKAFDSLSKTKLDEKEMEIGGTYELFSVQLGEVTRIYLRGECPSNQEPFFEGCHPDCKTVEQALNFRNGFKLNLKFNAPLNLT